MDDESLAAPRFIYQVVLKVAQLLETSFKLNPGLASLFAGSIFASFTHRFIGTIRAKEPEDRIHITSLDDLREQLREVKSGKVQPLNLKNLKIDQIPATATKIPDELLDILQYGMQMASAAYCGYLPLKNWACERWCYIKDRTDHLRPAAVFYMSSTSTLGYIAVDVVNETIIVAFRGTEPTNMKNVMHDIDTDVESWDLNEEHGRVHRGFNAVQKSAYEIVEKVVLDLLRADCSGYDVLGIGHSLGGAAVELVAVKLKEKLNELALENIHVSVLLFGAPHVGDYRFKTYVESLFGDAYGRCISVVNENDIVPMILTGSGTGTETLAYSKKGGYVSTITKAKISLRKSSDQFRWEKVEREYRPRDKDFRQGGLNDHRFYLGQQSFCYHGIPTKRPLVLLEQSMMLGLKAMLAGLKTFFDQCGLYAFGKMFEFINRMASA